MKKLDDFLPKEEYEFDVAGNIGALLSFQEHSGYCKSPSGEIFDYYSEIAMAVSESIAINKGLFLDNEYWEKLLAQQYPYSKGYTNEQYCAMLMCVWLGYPFEVFKLIADRRQKYSALYILNIFMCGYDMGQVRKFLSNKEKNHKKRANMLSSITFKGKCYIQNANHYGKNKIPAFKYDENTIIVGTNCDKYKIIYEDEVV